MNGTCQAGYRVVDRPAVIGQGNLCGRGSRDTNTADCGIVGRIDREVDSERIVDVPAHLVPCGDCRYVAGKRRLDSCLGKCRFDKRCHRFRIRKLVVECIDAEAFRLCLVDISWSFGCIGHGFRLILSRMKLGVGVDRQYDSAWNGKRDIGGDQNRSTVLHEVGEAGNDWRIEVLDAGDDNRLVIGRKRAIKNVLFQDHLDRILK